MTTAKLTQSDLNQFTGSENWYRHGLNGNVTYTDGAQYLANKGGAYWLLDAIAICQLHEKRVAAEEFGHVDDRQIELLHRLHRAPGIVAVVMINIR